QAAEPAPCRLRGQCGRVPVEHDHVVVVGEGEGSLDVPSVGHVSDEAFLPQRLGDHAGVFSVIVNDENAHADGSPRAEWMISGSDLLSPSGYARTIYSPLLRRFWRI